MSHSWKTRAVILVGALSAALPFGQANGQTQRRAQPSSGAVEAKADANEQAKAVLKEMSTTLASAKTMRFKIRSLVPIRIATGNWITLVGGATVMREGNDKLFVEAGGDLFPFRFYFDGKTVTAFAPQENVYAKKDAPGTIDEALDQAEKNGEATFVFADLVSSNPYAAMTQGLQNAVVVGNSMVDGVETQHLAVHGKRMDWEIWIGTKDRLPRMVTLTDLSEARKPTQTVQLSDWAVDQSLPTDAFSFNAPANAIEVPFRNPQKVMAAGRRASPANRPERGRSSGRTP